MHILKEIEKTREYLDYLEEHILNIRKAWVEIQDKCNDMFFIQTDVFYDQIGLEVTKHDLSKISEYEFVQYRKAFFPTSNEKKYNMSDAWKHHLVNNKHHWENWIKSYSHIDNDWIIHCVHMVVDWVAMGYKFNDTAQQYYEKNKDKIQLPDEAIKLIYQIFERLYPNGRS